MAGPERRVDVRDAEEHLLELLAEVEAGQVVTLTRAGQDVARLVPSEPTTRAWGCFEGQVHYQDDAFEALEPEDARAWEEPLPSM